MIENAIRIFQELLALDWNNIDSNATFFAKPVLYWPALWPHLETFIATLKSDGRSRAETLLDYLRQVHASLADRYYPAAYGPLEDIHSKYLRGEISLISAMALATEPTCYNCFSPYYTNSRCDQQKEINGRIREELLGQFAYLERMAVASRKITDPVIRDNNFLEMLTAPAICALSVATTILTEIPDGSLFDRCQQLYRPLEQMPVAGSSNPFLPELYYHIGILYLNPYFSGKSMSQIDELHKAWVKRYYTQPGGGEFRDVNIPECLEASELAVVYLQKALIGISGTNKPVVERALENALYCRRVLKEKSNEKSPTTLEFEKNKKNEGPRADESIVRDNFLSTSPLMTLSPRELIERHTQQALFVLLRNEIAGYLQEYPHISYEIYKKEQEVLESYPNEALQEQHFQTGVQVLYKLALPFVVSNQYATTEKCLQSFHEYSTRIPMSPVDYFSNILCIAFLDVEKNDSGRGLDMLYTAVGKIKEIGQPLELIPLCEYSIALSLVTGGNKFYAKGQFPMAIKAYALALTVAIDHGYSNNLKRLVANITDLGIRGDDQAYFLAITTLVEFSPIFTKKGLSHLDSLLNQSFHKLVIKSMSMGKRANLFMLLMLMTKGYHFRSMIENEVKLPKIEDQKGILLLEEINSLFQQSSVKFSPARHKMLNKETLLSAYISKTAKVPGTDEFAGFSNLQIEYDDLIQKRRLEALPGYPAYLTTDQIEALLDDNTVLVNIFLGGTNEDKMGLYVNLVTKHHFEISLCVVSGIPMTPDLLADADAQMIAHPMALLVSSIRDEILLDPLDGDVLAMDAKYKMEELGRMLFSGNIPVSLAKLRQNGITKMCIWPHSVLHYLPFHLLPYEQGLLSDYWSVRIIPDIALLAPEATRENNTHLAKLAVLAMSFTTENPLGLDTLTEAIGHAEKLASLFDSKPTVDRQLTKAAFVDKLKQSQWVHLYTHGYLTPSAPAFQCFFLHPDENDKGIFYAHELIGLDLSHVDLLTLSACESGLGRFDAMDNLRGLAANFFIAGVSTIIATLWEAETNSSAFFFQRFYECLKSGMTKLDAYKQAQKDTRMSFPEQRDWGAFCYLGR